MRHLEHEQSADSAPAEPPQNQPASITRAPLAGHRLALLSRAELDPFWHTTVVPELGGTTTVVFFAGGGGLLLLIQPDSMLPRSTYSNNLSYLSPRESLDFLIDANIFDSHRIFGTGRLRKALSSVSYSGSAPRKAKTRPRTRQGPPDAAAGPRIGRQRGYTVVGRRALLDLRLPQSARKVSRWLDNFIGHQQFKGRGAVSNPAVRFESTSREQTHDGWYEEEILEHLTETVLPDRARSVITTNDSPDVGFRSIHQSLSRMQSRLRLLLRAPQPCLPGPVPGPGFRDQAVLQGGCRQAARGRTRQAEICVQTHRARASIPTGISRSKSGSR